MTISPERKRVAEHVRKLAAQENSGEAAAKLLRRADLIEASDSRILARATRRLRPPPKRA
jgi:hypothetical protein